MTLLKQLRNYSGETQAEIAGILGITRAAYTNIENGKREPDFETIKKLANHFSVTTDYLLGREKSRDEKKEPAASNSENNGFTPEIMELAEMIDALPPDRRAVVHQLLRTLADDGNKSE